MVAATPIFTGRLRPFSSAAPGEQSRPWRRLESWLASMQGNQKVRPNFEALSQLPLTEQQSEQLQRAAGGAAPSDEPRLVMPGELPRLVQRFQDVRKLIQCASAP